MKKTNAFIFLLALSVNSLFNANVFAWEAKGDVRAKYQTDWKEERDNHFKVEASLLVDHLMPESWVKLKLKASTATNHSDNAKIDVEKVLLGYQITPNAFIELGRSPMDDLFDSKVQYDSHFNGIHAFFKHELADYGTLFVHGGPQVIDSHKNSYGAIGECGLCHLFDGNMTVKYSHTYWDKDYQISQITYKYDFPTLLWDMPHSFYAAGLKNHNSSQNNYGYYLGMTFGSIKEANDLSIDVNYQRVKSEAIPTFDHAGIGTGVQTKIAYAITDELTVQGKISTTKCAEVSAIYRW